MVRHNIHLHVTHLQKLSQSGPASVKIKRKKKIILPPALDIVYSGDLVLIYPEWTFLGYANSPQPGSAGWDYSGTDRSYPIHVTSDEYTYSVINDNAVVVLSKVESYTPVVTDTDGFYLAKMSIDSSTSNKTLYSFFNIHDKATTVGLPDVVFTFTKLCDIYDNSIITIAVLCNQLANINRRFSFSISSETKFTFHFTINMDSSYLPLLSSNGLNNTFSYDYFSDNILYYTSESAMNWWYNTWSQTIDLSQGSTSNVILDNRTYYADGTKRYIKNTLEPTTSKAAVNYVISDIPVDISVMLGIDSAKNNSIVWIIVAICIVIIIAVIIFTRSKRKPLKSFSKPRKAMK